MPLLPTEGKGVPPKETSPHKTAGKKDKDGKGGGKKGQESKGGKGSKCDPPGEIPSGTIGCTAWPPCVALASLVDVFSTGDKSQVARGEFCWVQVWFMLSAVLVPTLDCFY